MEVTPKDKRFYICIGISILIVLFIAYQDVQGFKMFSAIGGGYTGSAFEKSRLEYMAMFWAFAYSIIIAVGGLYFLFRKDISETLAVVGTALILIWSGLEDILYYWILKLPLDSTMPWLFKTRVMGGVAKLMGLDTVTPTSLYVGLGLGIILIYFLVGWLKKTNFTWNGLKI